MNLLINNRAINKKTKDKNDKIKLINTNEAQIRFSHGIGRSGEITEPQPKAAGASLIARLTNYMVVDVMRIAGQLLSHL